MTVQALLRVMTPAISPVATGTPAEWSRVEQRLGTRLPTDYKQYIDLFGLGDPEDFLVVFNPFTDSPHMNLIEQAEAWPKGLKMPSLLVGMDHAVHTYPYPLYPERGGMLPWGTTTNFGDLLCWLTEGDPDDWTVVVSNIRDNAFEHYDLSMTDFLAEYKRGNINSDVLGPAQ